MRAAAPLFGPAHGRFGLHDEGFDVCASGQGEGGTDRGRDRHLADGQIDRRLEQISHPIAQAEDSRIVDLLAEHHELVASDARDGLRQPTDRVVRAERPVDPLGDIHQHADPRSRGRTGR